MKEKLSWDMKGLKDL